MKKLKFLMLVLTSAFGLLTLMFLVSPAGAMAPAQEGKYVGAETCAACHEEVSTAFNRTIHGTKAKLKAGEEISGCETCHGPGGAHVDSQGAKGTIFSFKADIPAAEKTEKCLNCHNKESANFVFKSSDHMKGSVTCSDCHEVHSAMGKDMLLSNDGYKLCLRCHREIEPKILLNERHRITEGIVKCIDCHKNHEPSTRSHLGGFNAQTCFKCHTDKQGPFIYEHPCIRVEGCVACHDPHGSVNRHMLLHQAPAELCFSCHQDAPSFHTRFNATTNCTNCHSAIHGSQLSPFLLK
jgi:DmsE family decaheme c-type cytochrome